MVTARTNRSGRFLLDLVTESSEIPARKFKIMHLIIKRMDPG